jgi:hypothetical protein
MSIHEACLMYAKWEMRNFQEKFFENTDFIAYYGGIEWDSIAKWKTAIDELALLKKERNVESILILLSTTGGVVSAVERMVDITRHYYEQVFFIIPDFAMSAGTIWCMSGDKIYMNYASALGPIDPQVESNDGKWVPALGYLDKAKEIFERSKKGEVSELEIMMLSHLDLAQMRQYEQAVELSIDLLKKWLVEYKFKDWTKHRTTNAGAEVTLEEKQIRAQEIAQMLSDNNRWNSHTRFISAETLRNIVKLEIDDFSDKREMCNELNKIHQYIIDYMDKFNISMLTFPSFPANINDINDINDISV